MDPTVGQKEKKKRVWSLLRACIPRVPLLAAVFEYPFPSTPAIPQLVPIFASTCPSSFFLLLYCRFDASSVDRVNPHGLLPHEESHRPLLLEHDTHRRRNGSTHDVLRLLLAVVL